VAGIYRLHRGSSAKSRGGRLPRRSSRIEREPGDRPHRLRGRRRLRRGSHRLGAPGTASTSCDTGSESQGDRPGVRIVAARRWSEWRRSGLRPDPWLVSRGPSTSGAHDAIWSWIRHACRSLIRGAELCYFCATPVRQSHVPRDVSSCPLGYIPDELGLGLWN
jgi:hypothetical protein